MRYCTLHVVLCISSYLFVEAVSSTCGRQNACPNTGVSREEDSVTNARRSGGMLMQFRADGVSGDSSDKPTKLSLLKGKGARQDPPAVDPALKGKIDGIDKRLAALEAKVAAMPNMEKSIANWEKKVEQYDKALTHRIDDLDKKMGEVTNGVTSLKSADQTSDARLLALEEKLTKCMAIATDLKSVNSTREARVKELEEKLADVMSQVVTLKSTNTTQDSRIAALETTANDLSETVVALQAVNSTRGVRLSAAEEELKRLDEESTAMEDDFGGKLEEAKADTETSIKGLEERSSSLETEKAAIKGEIADLTGGFEAHKEDIETRMKNLEAEMEHKVLGLEQAQTVQKPNNGSGVALSESETTQKAADEISASASDILTTQVSSSGAKHTATTSETFSEGQTVRRSPGEISLNVTEAETAEGHFNQAQGSPSSVVQVSSSATEMAHKLFSDVDVAAIGSAPPSFAEQMSDDATVGAKQTKAPPGIFSNTDVVASGEYKHAREMFSDVDIGSIDR